MSTLTYIVLIGISYRSTTDMTHVGSPQHQQRLLNCVWILSKLYKKLKANKCW